jgi:hypothetical protein
VVEAADSSRLAAIRRAQELVQAFLQYNDNTSNAAVLSGLNVVLEVRWTMTWSWTITKPISAACLATSGWTR